MILYELQGPAWSQCDASVSLVDLLTELHGSVCSVRYIMHTATCSQQVDGKCSISSGLTPTVMIVAYIFSTQEAQVTCSIPSCRTRMCNTPTMTPATSTPASRYQKEK